MATIRHQKIYEKSKKFYFGMDELRARQNELMRPTPPTLIDEEWARHLTWKEAYTLQHILIIFESLTSQEDPSDGPEWVSLTYAEWHEEMPFLKQSQVKMSIQSLEKKGFIRSQDTHKRDSIYRWKSYAINLDEIRNISSQVTDIYVELIEPTDISMTYNGISKESPQVLDFNVGLNKPTDISNTYEISSHNSLKSTSVNSDPPWDNPHPQSVQKSPYIYDDLKEEDLREDLKTKDLRKDLREYKNKNAREADDDSSQIELPVDVKTESCSGPLKSSKATPENPWYYDTLAYIPDDFHITDEMANWFKKQNFSVDINRAHSNWTWGMKTNKAQEKKRGKYKNWIKAWQDAMRRQNNKYQENLDELEFQRTPDVDTLLAAISDFSGTAYVSISSPVINALNNHGLDKLLLVVEWAKTLKPSPFFDQAGNKSPLFENTATPTSICKPDNLATYLDKANDWKAKCNAVKLDPDSPTVVTTKSGSTFDAVICKQSKNGVHRFSKQVDGTLGTCDHCGVPHRIFEGK